MAAKISAIRKRFVHKYSLKYREYKELALLAEQFVREILQYSYIDIHNISSRAKSPESVHLKVLKKRYKRPSQRLTDKLGVRVVTYYARDVDRVVEMLKRSLVWDSKRSVDKRDLLGPRDFGYTSVHLIARLRENDTRTPKYAELAGQWFEVQVRSILEHAWAEIEHEVVFKSGTEYPDLVNRRFAAIAGALEILNSEFFDLKGERNILIEYYRKRYSDGEDIRRKLDAARLLGFLECEFPQNPSWREVERRGQPFRPRIESVCVVALQACKLITPRALRRHMRRPSFKEAVRSYATAQLVEPEAVSHLALVVISVALRSRRVLEDYFRDMLGDPGLRAVCDP